MILNMRTALYGLACACILVGCVCVGFAPLGFWYGRAAAMLLVSGLLLGIAATILGRKATRKCSHCGERTAQSLAFCRYCGRSRSGWAPL